MIRNRIDIFLLLGFLSILSVGFSAAEKRLEVNIQSSSFQNKLIDIETISQGLISREMFYSIPVKSLEDNSFVKFIISDSTIYAIEKCQFNVWEWKDTAWVNLYKLNNKGWCIPYYYFYEKKLIGFTGSGFWTSESGIYFFNSDTGSWELINTENKVPHFVSMAAFRIGNDTIISFMDDLYDYGKQNSKEQNYGFDLKLNKWFIVKNNFDLNGPSKNISKNYSNRVFDMENTAHSISTKYHLILDKKTLIFYYIYTNINNPEFYYNNCSSTTVIKDGETILIKDEVPANAFFAGTMSFSELNEVKDESQEHNLFLWILIGVIFLITSVIGLFWKLKPSKNNGQLFQESSLILISRITEATGQAMNSNELDMLIGIYDDPNPDSRRVKRSRIIQDLNAEYKQLEGKVLITRQKDLKDKRYMLYHIEK